MNRCDPDMLTSYVDGALSAAQARRVEAHLAACPACAETARAHGAIKRRVAAGAAAITVPAGLASRVGEALDRVPPPHAGSGNGSHGPGGGLSGWRGLGLPLGVAVLVTSGGLWFSRPLWQPRPMDVTALVWHHRDAMNPPASATLFTKSETEARAWARARAGSTSIAPALAAPLRGVGVCRVGETPAVIWMYDAGRPVSLIEIPREERPPDWAPVAGHNGWRAGTYGGYNAVIWKEEGRTFALVSDLPTDRLMHLLERSP